MDKESGMEKSEQKISEAIEFFETMLESMPGDRTSLECLVVAYEQIGAQDKRRECLIELANTLIKEQAFADARGIIEELKQFPDDDTARATIQLVRDAIEQADPGDVGINASSTHFDNTLELSSDGSFNFFDPAIEIHSCSRATLSAEMDLVWAIRDKEILPREICEKLIQTLTEFPLNERPQLISALALLDDQHPEWSDKVIEELIKISHVPAVPLEYYDWRNVMFTGLSSQYIIIRGVIPFANMANEYLVAILNPLDKALQQDVSKRLGSKCHFFLAHPRTCQQMLDSMLEADISANAE